MHTPLDEEPSDNPYVLQDLLNLKGANDNKIPFKKKVRFFIVGALIVATIFMTIFVI